MICCHRGRLPPSTASLWLAAALFEIHSHITFDEPLPTISMRDLRYTHVILDEHSGEPLGAVRDIDELEDGTQFGIVRLFDSPEAPTYTWLRGLLLLPVSEAAPHVRNHVAWEIAHEQPA